MQISSAVVVGEVHFENPSLREFAHLHVLLVLGVAPQAQVRQVDDEQDAGAIAQKAGDLVWAREQVSAMLGPGERKHRLHAEAHLALITLAAKPGRVSHKSVVRVVRFCGVWFVASCMNGVCVDSELSQPV